jgi:hypothetical protein
MFIDSKKRKSTLIDMDMYSNMTCDTEKKYEDDVILLSKKKISTSQAIKTFCRIRPADNKNGKYTLTQTSLKSRRMMTRRY